MSVLFSYLTLFPALNNALLQPRPLCMLTGFIIPPGTHVRQWGHPGEWFLLTQLARCFSSALLINEVIKSKTHYFMLEPCLLFLSNG